MRWCLMCKIVHYDTSAWTAYTNAYHGVRFFLTQCIHCVFCNFSFFIKFFWYFLTKKYLWNLLSALFVCIIRIIVYVVKMNKLTIYNHYSIEAFTHFRLFHFSIPFKFLLSNRLRAPCERTLDYNIVSRED